MTLRRRMAVLAVAPLFALAACGSDAGDLVGGASSGGGDGPSGDLSQETFGTAVSEALLKARTAHIAAEIRTLGQSVTLEGDVEVADDPAGYAADISISAPSMGHGVHVVVVDEILYLNLGPMTGGKYARIRVDDTRTPIGQLMAQFVESADLSKSLEAIRDGATSFEAVGREQIDGVDTTKYEVTVDTGKVLAAQGMADLPGMAGRLPDTLTYQLWIGDDNLLRRMSFSLGSVMDLTVNITAWGEPVDISAPPLSQITDAQPFGGVLTG